MHETTSSEPSLEALQGELTRLRSATDSTLTAIMMVDRDLVVTYANDATVKLLAKHERAMQDAFPDFSADTIVGTCIDIFHQDPAHQREMLADPANLPHSVDIHIGELTFNINVTAQLDEAGKYLGNTLEWYDVTETRATENSTARLMSAIHGANVAIMMIDRDLVVTYVNQASQTLLGEREDEMQAVYPQFRADAIVGTCIDIFHQDPAHQRAMLADPRNLPHSTDIQVGPLTFNINVTAAFDANGAYIGNTLEWYDVTETRAAERENADFVVKMKAIGRSLATIEFEPDGRIVTANDAFCQTVGYTLEELAGQHHRMFVAPEIAATEEYRQMWLDLASGKSHSGEFQRRRKDGEDVWIQARYGALTDDNGKVYRVFKCAFDITAEKIRSADFESQLDAINRVRAVAEYDLSGTIRHANQNFLDMTGYRLEDLVGRSADTLLSSAPTVVATNREVWERLANGQSSSGEYEMCAKDGSTIWLQGTYNAVLDLTGRPYKVMQFATDVSAQKRLQRTIEASLAEVRRVMEKAATGDLNDRVRGDFDGDFAVLTDAVNGCLNKLGHSLTEVSRRAESVNGVAYEISKGNENLSARTESQAAFLEETAARVEQLSVGVREAASTATDASKLATSARTQAESGGQVAMQAVEAMQAIDQSSKKIAEIIGVIDDIAFQTNLLALNAAVEAARAGDQGRGFAVVASEVRNLAQRSASAAKEIKGLIQDSVKKVEEGSKYVNASGDTLTEIVDSIAKVSEMFSEIAKSSIEQAGGVSDISKTMSTLDDMTQQNAALVEQTSGASRSMTEQMAELAALVAAFKVDGSPGVAEARHVVGLRGKAPESRAASGW